MHALQISEFISKTPFYMRHWAFQQKTVKALKKRDNFLVFFFVFLGNFLFEIVSQRKLSVTFKKAMHIL